MPDDLSATRDELAALRAANARLRQVVEGKDTEIAALRAAHARHGELVSQQAELTRSLELRVAELERRLGMDSRNSSTPPSKEPLAAKAHRKAARRASLRERSKDRRPGGQPGHEGAGAAGAGTGWGQGWEIPPVRLEKVHWLLPRLHCGGCGKVTTARAGCRWPRRWTAACPPGPCSYLHAERGRDGLLFDAKVDRQAEWVRDRRCQQEAATAGEPLVAFEHGGFRRRG